MGGHPGSRNTSARHLNVGAFWSHRDNGVDHHSLQPLMLADVDDASQADASQADTSDIDTMKAYSPSRIAKNVI